MEGFRELRFTNLNQVLQELSSLEKAGKGTLGNWSYFQILTHLAETIEASYTLVPPPANPVDARTTEVLFRRLQKSGKMKPGYLNPALPQSREEGDTASAMNRLMVAIRSFGESKQLNPEPTLGYLNHEQFEFLHAIHCALHLGFVKAG
ncbi:MAG: DUF1569 domain-containing protein [Spirochaetia bacterium]|nr:DUF1569 domain-containing protein [Spirochaetia bacterium]